MNIASKFCEHNCIYCNTRELPMMCIQCHKGKWFIPNLSDSLDNLRLAYEQIKTAYEKALLEQLAGLDGEPNKNV